MEVVVLMVLVIIMILLFRMDNGRSSHAYDTSLYQRDVKEELSLIRHELVLFNTPPVVSRWAPPEPMYERKMPVEPPSPVAKTTENTSSIWQDKRPLIPIREDAATEPEPEGHTEPEVEKQTQVAIPTDTPEAPIEEQEAVNIPEEETAIAERPNTATYTDTALPEKAAIEEQNSTETTLPALETAAEVTQPGEATEVPTPQEAATETIEQLYAAIPAAVKEQEEHEEQAIPTPTATEVPSHPDTEQPDPEDIIPPAGPAEQPSPTYQQSDQPDFWSRFMERNPDLEKFIGENLINKVGIAVLVLGIAFFVKYAIDQNWINETGRVSIGILCGAMLVGVAHYLRNNYRSFSSVLAGGGMAVFYFTIAFTFHQYHLMSQAVAFSVMVVITGFAVALSVLYNRLELAIIATIGGFAAPFLVSTGSGNYVVLFTYMAILNSGLLSLAYFKKWLPLNVMALAFTILIFGGWLVDKCIPVHHAHMLTNGLVFATIFYVLFLGMNIINPVKHKQPFKPFDFSILLGLNALYFSTGMVITHYLQGGRWQGAFTVWMGFVNLVLAWFFFKRTEKDKNLIYLLIGLTLTFFTLAVPVQLHGHTITLFWSAEFVLLYWLYQRSKISLYKSSSALIAVLSLISLAMDWNNASKEISNLALIFTNVNGFVTNVVSIVCMAVYLRLLQQDNKEEDYLPGVKNNDVRIATLAVGGIITYLTLIFGVNLLCNASYHSYAVPNTYHILVNEVLALAAIWYLSRKKEHSFFVLRMAIITYCAAYYLSSTAEILYLRNMTLQGKYPAIHYFIHWLDLGLLLAISYMTIQFLQKKEVLKKETRPIYTWTFSIVLLVMFSIECMHAYVSIVYQPGKLYEISYQYGKAGLTIVWTVASFAFLWLGMKHRYKLLRIMGLSLFGLVLGKLLLFDIRGISEGGKIAAFILLGVLLLTVSFMYQKLKKMLIDDKE